MHILKSMCSAFLMYSKIPMPMVEWKEENKRYAFCFFPLIGVIIGAVFALWWYVCKHLQIGQTMFAAGGILIPILITGGIHMDGFLDVSDAKSSYGEREQLLQIMSDSHIGAFAVIHLCIWALIQFGCMSQVTEVSQVWLLGFGFVVSRALSGMAAVTFQGAKTEGTLQSFAKPAYKKITLTVLSLCLGLCIAGILWVDWKMGSVMLVAGTLAFCYYRVFSYKRFGGITGDLAGYFVQIFETAILVAVVFAQRIIEVLL